MLVPTFRTSEGSLAGNISLQPNGNQITITAPNGGEVILRLQSQWNTYWIFDNGAFYHREIVAPGETTAILLEGVEVSDSQLWNTFQLEVLADAIQAEGGAAQDAWGSIPGL